MTIVSLGLVGWSCEVEPFFGPFNLRQALISLVGGGIGIVFWIVWAGGVGYALVRRWVPLWMTILFLLALVGLALNGIVIFEFLDDRQNWATQ